MTPRFAKTPIGTSNGVGQVKNPDRVTAHEDGPKCQTELRRKRRDGKTTREYRETPIVQSVIQPPQTSMRGCFRFDSGRLYLVVLLRNDRYCWRTLLWRSLRTCQPVLMCGNFWKKSCNSCLNITRNVRTWRATKHTPGVSFPRTTQTLSIA